MILALWTQVTFCHAQRVNLRVISRALPTYLTVVLEGKVERKAADAFGLSACRDLQALDDTGVALVLKTGVFTLSILTDDSEINVAVTGRESGKGLAQNNRRVYVELLTHGDVP